MMWNMNANMHMNVSSATRVRWPRALLRPENPESPHVYFISWESRLVPENFGPVSISW